MIVSKNKLIEGTVNEMGCGTTNSCGINLFHNNMAHYDAITVKYGRTVEETSEMVDVIVKALKEYYESKK